MRSRQYRIKLNKTPADIVINVYADRSVEMMTEYQEDGQTLRRRDYLQTREEAAWSLSFARACGAEITKTYL